MQDRVIQIRAQAVLQLWLKRVFTRLTPQDSTLEPATRRKIGVVQTNGGHEFLRFLGKPTSQDGCFLPAGIRWFW